MSLEADTSFKGASDLTFFLAKPATSTAANYQMICWRLALRFFQLKCCKGRAGKGWWKGGAGGE